MDTKSDVQSTPFLLVAGSSWLQVGLQMILSSITKAELIDLADDIPSALDWVNQYPNGLLVIDLDTVSLGGLEQIKDIKGGFPNVSCIVITSDFDDFAAAREFGADAVLLKGFSTEELSAAIQQITSGKERSDNHESIQ